MMNRLIGGAIGAIAGSLLLLPLLTNNSAEAFMLGDDLIGSLPVMTPDGDGYQSKLQLMSLDGGDFVQEPVAFMLEGLQADLDTLILDAFGSGFVVAEGINCAGNSVYAFYGDVSIELERSALEDNRVMASVRPGASYLGSDADIIWDGNNVWGFIIKKSQFELGYDQVLATGVADLGRVELDMYDHARLISHIGFEVTKDRAMFDVLGI